MKDPVVRRFNRRILGSGLLQPMQTSISQLERRLHVLACWIFLRIQQKTLNICAWLYNNRHCCTRRVQFGFSLLGMASSYQQKYQKNLRDALQVTDTTGPWTVIVQVLIKYPTKPSRKDPKLLFKKFLLTDMKGTAISAVTFSAIEHFDRIFEPFKRYYITNAAVKLADPRYKIGEYNYSWTLYPRTHVQLIPDPVPQVSPYSFDYMKYSEMFRVANRDDCVAVKGLIVHSIPVPSSTRPFVRDYVIVDEEEQPMLLRVWEDVLNENETRVTEKLPKPTFVAALDLKVTTHNGLSLTTGFTSHFMVDPPLRETKALLSWYDDHNESIGQLLLGEAYKSADILLPPPSKADTVPVKHVLTSMLTLKTAWVSGRIHLVPAQSKMWHPACDKCKKTVSLTVGSEFTCTFCHEEMKVEPRCHVHVWINDVSGTLSATLFAAAAEQLIGYTAVELLEASNKNSSLEDEIGNKINNKPVMCFLKDYDRKNPSRFERSFPVVKLYITEEADSDKDQEDCGLVVDASTTPAQGSALVPIEAEKQPFSPGIKTVVDEIAIKVGVDQGIPVSSTAVKRGIVFAEISNASEAVTLHEVSSSADGSVAPCSGSESPIKKQKNAATSK